MSETDVRWHQRLANYRSALAQLQAAVDLADTRELSPLEQQGTIQAFEFTHELAWKVMKDYFFHQGASDITGSRDAVRQAFAAGLVVDGDAWMEMIASRNQSSHTYNRAVALELVARITQSYATLFSAFATRMEALRDA